MPDCKEKYLSLFPLKNSEDELLVVKPTGMWTLQGITEAGGEGTGSDPPPHSPTRFPIVRAELRHRPRRQLVSVFSGFVLVLWNDRLN